MPRFTYTARDRSGQRIQSALEAPTRKDAVRLLTARGLQPLNLAESGGGPAVAGKKPPASSARTGRVEGKEAPKANGAFAGLGALLASLRGSASAPAAGPRKIVLSRRDRLPFFSALHELISSGLSAGEAVRLLGVRLKEPRLKYLCSAIWERLSEGRPLSRSMEEFPEVFDSSTIHLIQAGEATGNLNETLRRLIDYYTEQRELQQKLLTAMAYPAFLIVVAIGVVLFFVFFLLPRIQTLLDSLGGKLPWATRVLVGLSQFLVGWGLPITIGALVGLVVLWQWRRTPRGREAADRLSLRLPVVRPFAINSAVLQFTQTLGVLLENGITTAEALRMTERVVKNQGVRRAVGQATDRVLEGESLSSSLAKTGYFPELVLDRLSVGENTGNLVPSLRQIAASYQKQLSRQLQVFTSVVASSVLISVFVFIAFLAYAIVTAIFAVSASFQF